MSKQHDATAQDESKEKNTHIYPTELHSNHSKWNNAKRLDSATIGFRNITVMASCVGRTCSLSLAGHTHTHTQALSVSFFLFAAAAVLCVRSNNYPPRERVGAPHSHTRAHTRHTTNANVETKDGKQQKKWQDKSIDARHGQ